MKRKIKTNLGSFYGINIFADEEVPEGCADIMDKDDKLIMRCGGIGARKQWDN